MKKVYLYFTKCTESYNEIFKDKLFKKIPSGLSFKLEGFGANNAQKKLASIFFEKKLEVNYNIID